MSSALLLFEAVPNAAARAHQRGTWLLSVPDREVGADGSVGRVPLLLVVAGYTQPAQLPRAKYSAQFPRAKYVDTGPFKADDEWGSISGGHLVKAVRNAPPSVEVVDVDEPEGEGELVWVVATEICAPDLKYLRWGSTQIAGHEFAGVLPHTAGRLQLHRQTTGSDHHADRRTQHGPRRAPRAA